MKLLCVSNYRAGTVAYSEGEEIECSDEQGALLLRDSPGSFVANEPEEKTDKDLTVKELIALAAERGVDLDGATKKADILTKLLAAASASTMGDPGGLTR